VASTPSDVRLMNAAASALFGLAALTLLAAGVLWLTRAPWFAIRAIQIEGDLSRNNLHTIRANAMPQLSGNFFSIDLQRARAAFQAVPWVRQAVVRRVWPNRLAVQLQEHQAVALWESEGADARLVNDRGEVFEANLGDVEDQALPVLEGPAGQSALMWSMVQRLQPLLAPLQIGIDRLTLSSRGSWRLGSDDGVQIELGRGDVAEVLARVSRFARTLDQVTGPYGKPLVHADLRHTDGYAVRLQGVTTTLPAPAANKQ
jgi:cell division protein FtsQ